MNNVLIIVYERPCQVTNLGTNIDGFEELFIRGHKLGQVGKNLTDEELSALLQV